MVVAIEKSKPEVWIWIFLQSYLKQKNAEQHRKYFVSYICLISRILLHISEMCLRHWIVGVRLLNLDQRPPKRLFHRSLAYDACPITVPFHLSAMGGWNTTND